MLAFERLFEDAFGNGRKVVTFAPRLCILHCRTGTHCTRKQIATDAYNFKRDLGLEPRPMPYLGSNIIIAACLLASCCFVGFIG